ncbi:MAG TPA: DNA internalization-related competence protein ComEC/Rec2 [Clostridiaceae bacterium]|nr:DNA internalization-related competence protein ComEC/Rec2 [Clostridiaceae bacterium]
MKRPLLLFSVSFIIGVLTARITNSHFFIIASVFLIFSTIILLLPGRSGSLCIAFIMLLFYSFGALEFLIIDNINKNRFKEFENENVTVCGVISSHPNLKDTRVSYTVSVKEIISGGSKVKKGGKILFTTLLGDDWQVYEHGREIRISGKLNLPAGRRNPGGFDYREYLAQSGVSATIFARKENVEVGERRKTNVLVSLGLFLRNRIVSVIDKSLPEQQAGLLNGMLIGSREGLTKEVQQVFSDSGLSHIMAVSGANIAFIVFPLLFLLRKLLHLKRIIANIATILVLIVFVSITGFEPSVLRAAIMAIVILAGQILHRESDALTSISFAALALLLYNPYNLFNIGFQLSFAATISLVLFYKNIKNILSPRFIPKGVTDVLSVTLAAQIGVLPITLYYFNKFSLVSIISNLLVAPVIEAITILGSIMAIIGQVSIMMSRLIGYVNCAFLSFVLFISKITASLPFAVIRTITPHFLLIVLYYIAVWFFFWYKPMKNIRIEFKYYILAFAVLTASFCVPMLAPKGLEVVFIDVGQGDSIFVRTHAGTTVLIDGGGNSSMESSYNIGDSVVIPFLLDYGVTKLDLVIATHGHDDHIQGLIPVLKDFRVDNFVFPECAEKEEFHELLEVSRLRTINVFSLKKGDRIRLDGDTYFYVLNPNRNFNGEKQSLNNSSLVLKLHYKNVSMLFTGDIEKEIESKLVQDKDDISADILKAAHHGSDTSTTQDFLEEVSPKVVVISVGKNNFGHPSQEVIERLEEKRIPVLRTDKHGAVIVKSNGRQVTVRTMLS